MTNFYARKGKSMKKVLCLMLSLVMLACCISCTPTEQTPTTDLFNLFDEGRVPSTITTMVSYNYTDAANADNDVSLSGYYKTETKWEKSIFTYSYERLATVEEQNPTGRVKKITGKIYRNGNQVSSTGDTFEDGSALPGAAFNLSLKADNFDSYTVNADGKSYTAKVTGNNIQKALGVALSANAEGVAISVTSNGTVITGVTVSYTTTSGAGVFIATSYTYTPIELDWPVGN